MQEYEYNDKPQWAQGKQINEKLFCQEFCAIYQLVYTEGTFFSWRGAEKEDTIRQLVYNTIRPFYATSLATRTNKLLDSLKLELHTEGLPFHDASIYCNNGVYNIAQQRFFSDMSPCRCRLPVDYNPRARKPETWLSFLRDLLEEEDIRTLQEYMGYCLLPINYGQKMLLIIGRGGEGKSRIGITASKLWGSCMVSGSLPKLENNRFARADLQHKLLMVDDDLQLEALTSTGIIKSIITSEQLMDLEKKGVQSYQGRMYCRLMAFGNGNLRALHDRSYGFFRRQIILTTKPRPKDREDNPLLARELERELEGILLWCIEGAQRLLEQDFCFTISQRANTNLQEAIREGNNTVDFLQSEGYIRLDPGAQISTRQLYSLYTDWCNDNMLPPLSAKSFSVTLQSEAARWGIAYSNRINSSNGKLVRGFHGIRAISQF